MLEAVRKKIVKGYRFIHPIMVAIFIATFLVLITFLSSFTLTATVFSEEGGGKEAASAGFANAAIFLIIAIVGGFLIFLLFKYKKGSAIQYLFGSALSLSGGFILFFFLIILIEDIQYYSSGLLVFASFAGGVTSDPFFLVFYTTDLELPLFIFSLVLGVVMTYIVLSGKFRGAQKNRFLLLLSGLMGAFLAVILPTWTVMFMLIGLSLYDIYSVKRGPIKSIIEMTEEERRDRMKERKKNLRRNQIIIETLKKNGISCPSCSSYVLKVEDNDAVACVDCGMESIIPGVTGMVVNALETADGKRAPSGGAGPFKRVPGSSPAGKNVRRIIRQRRINRNAVSGMIPFLTAKRFTLGRRRSGRKRGMDAEHLMRSMTYNTRDWDLGIGDLVFYSMLAGHSFQYGAGYYDKVGLFAPLLMFTLSIIGILIGFVITIRALERNKILPGLPMSMFIGIFGFLIGATVLWLW